MKLYLKKIIARILVNDFIGFLISSLNKNLIKFYNLKIDVSSPIIKSKVAAALFFKTYESAEIRHINEYLINYKSNIIELGASIGVITTFLAKKNPDAKIYSCEADSRFIPIIEENLNNNNVINVVYENLIIGQKGFSFKSGQINTEGKLVKDENSGKENILLSQLIYKYNIKNFVLVCDIEGAEYFILNDDIKIFEKCEMILIELHSIEINNRIISVKELEDKIMSIGYKIVKKYGNNIVAKK